MWRFREALSTLGPGEQTWMRPDGNQMETSSLTALMPPPASPVAPPGELWRLTTRTAPTDPTVPDRVLLQQTGSAHVFTIGRVSGSSMHIGNNPPTLGELHAYIKIDSQGLHWLSDNGSRNRTYVNGSVMVRRSTSPLQFGDVIEFGGTASMITPDGRLVDNPFRFQYMSPWLASFPPDPLVEWCMLSHAEPMSKECAHCGNSISGRNPRMRRRDAMGDNNVHLECLRAFRAEILAAYTSRLIVREGTVSNRDVTRFIEAFKSV